MTCSNHKLVVRFSYGTGNGWTVLSQNVLEKGLLTHYTLRFYTNSAPVQRGGLAIILILAKLISFLLPQRIPRVLPRTVIPSLGTDVVGARGMSMVLLFWDSRRRAGKIPKERAEP